jgi:tRNA(Ile)-lysidine synthase
MIYDKFALEVKKYHMLKPRDKILLAISGGPDSVALLLSFLKLKKTLHLKLAAVHINHKLRTKESNLDEKFVKELCKLFKVKLYIKRIDVASLAKKEKLSLEDAARQARLKVFEDLAQKQRINKVALAHTKDDQAETYLMRLLRGAGLKGLSGIWPIRKYGKIVLVRPFLKVSKKEIISFLKENKQSYRIDSSNLTTDYLRNKIRLEAIPYLRKNYNPQLIDVLCRQADISRLAYEYIHRQAKSAYLQICKSRRGEIIFDLAKLRNLDEAVALELIRFALNRLKGDLKDITFENLYTLWQAAQNRKGSEVVTVTNNIVGLREYSTLKIAKTSVGKLYGKSKNFIIKVNVPGITEVDELKCRIEAKILPNKKPLKDTHNKYIEYIDLTKIKNSLEIRTRLARDTFKPLGFKHLQSLKTFFINSKVPVSKRNRVPLLLDGKRIIWVVGYRISEDYRIKRGTSRILKLKVTYL